MLATHIEKIKHSMHFVTVYLHLNVSCLSICCFFFVFLIEPFVVGSVNGIIYMDYVVNRSSLISCSLAICTSHEHILPSCLLLVPHSFC